MATLPELKMVQINLIKIKDIKDKRGDLSVIDESELQFKIKRVFWIYDADRCVERGGHAHIKNTQCLIALYGKCKVTLDDGLEKKEVILNDMNKGLIIEPLIWRVLSNFSGECLLLVLSSELYDEKDYIRDYSEFRKICIK